MIDGVLVIDKPPAMTSHDVVAVVRRALRPGFGKVKVGHAGTLDPDATGVLVVCLGRATRLVPFVQASRKTYDARVRFGVTTTSLDAAGEVVEERDASALSEAAVCEVLKAFVGKVEQRPPMVSAVKVGGERLYAKARRGEEVERPLRTVVIYDIVLEDFIAGRHAEASFLVTCSPGTYVRTLAADAGERLGVGGHLAALRRLGSGRFSVDDSVALDDVVRLAAEGRVADVVLPMAAAMGEYPSVTVNGPQAEGLRVGRPLPRTGLDGPVAAVDEAGRLLAVIEDRDDAARPLVVVAPRQGDGDG